MSHTKPSVTIREADDGSFVIDGSIPAGDEEHGEHESMPMPMYENVTNTAPDIDKALAKAARILRQRGGTAGKEV